MPSPPLGLVVACLSRAAAVRLGRRTTRYPSVRQTHIMRAGRSRTVVRLRRLTTRSARPSSAFRLGTAFRRSVIGIHVRLPILRLERSTVPRRLQSASDSAQQRYDLHDHSVGHRLRHYKRSRLGLVASGAHRLACPNVRVPLYAGWMRLTVFILVALAGGRALVGYLVRNRK